MSLFEYRICTPYFSEKLANNTHAEIIFAITFTVFSLASVFNKISVGAPYFRPYFGNGTISFSSLSKLKETL